jgi:hypothetical protein
VNKQVEEGRTKKKKKKKIPEVNTEFYHLSSKLILWKSAASA